MCKLSVCKHEVEIMRMHMKHSLQAAALDGRLSEAVAAVFQETKAHELDSMREQLKKTFQMSLADGRLEDAVVAVRDKKQRKQQEKTLSFMPGTDGRFADSFGSVDANPINPEFEKARTVENMRQQLKKIFQLSVADGRLEEAVSAVREENERKRNLSVARCQTRNVLEEVSVDGRLSEAFTAMRHGTAAHGVDTMRKQLKKTFQMSVADGRLQAAVNALKKEKETHRVEALRQHTSVPDASAKEKETKHESGTLRHAMKHAFRSALMDGRLSETLAAMRNEKKACDVERLRERLKNVFQMSVADGRLQDVVDTVRQERTKKSLEAVRQRMKCIFHDAAVDGRLSQALALAKQERKANELESLRQQLKQTFLTSVSDGHLKHVLDAVKENASTHELEMLRHKMKHIFQSALINGRLSQTLAAMREEKTARSLERIREQMKYVLINASESGKLVAVLASMKKAEVSHPAEESSKTPCKPSAARNAARPIRRSNKLSNPFSDDIQSLQDQASSLQTLVAPVILPALPPRPPISARSTAATSQEFRMNADEAFDSRELRGSSLVRSYDALGKPHGGACPRNGSLRKASANIEAFALDAGEESCSSEVRAVRTDRDSSIVRSYDALSTRTEQPREIVSWRTSLARLPRPASPMRPLPPVTPPLKKPIRSAEAAKQSAMSLDLHDAHTDPCSNAAVAIRRRSYQMSKNGSWSSYPIAREESLRNPYSFLPPLASATSVKAAGKLQGRKHSSSMDSLLWGVAPLKSTLDLSVVGHYVL
jgi:hypothetical protein